MTGGRSSRFNWRGKHWKWLVVVARTMTVWIKWQTMPLYQRLPHVLSLGGFITVTVRFGFSAASWLPEPTARKDVKRHRGDACPGDNCHGSSRHRKGVLNPALVAARKNLNCRSAILRGIIRRLGKGVLARRVLDRRMIERAHLHDTSLQPITPPFLVRTQNFRHLLYQPNVS